VAVSTTVSDNGLVMHPYPFAGGVLDSGLMPPSGAWFYAAMTTGDASGGRVNLHMTITNPQDRIWVCKGYTIYSTYTAGGAVGVSIDSGVTMEGTALTGDFEFLAVVNVDNSFTPYAAVPSANESIMPTLPPTYVSPGRVLAFDADWPTNSSGAQYQAEFWGYYWAIDTARTVALGLYMP
jgi:hypothetical protein